MTINIHDAKTNLSRLIEDVMAGRSVTVANAGKPIVDLVIHREQRIIIGGLRGGFIYDDESFDDPDPAIANLFYGNG